MYVCVFIKFHTITTQCGPMIQVILYCLYWSSQGGINDTYDKRGYAYVRVVFYVRGHDFSLFRH